MPFLSKNICLATRMLLTQRSKLHISINPVRGKKKLAKKCPNYIGLRVQNTATQLRMDCKTVSRVSRQASSYKDCHVSRDLPRIGKDRLQVNKQCIQINKNSVSIFIRLSCNSCGADESAPLSLLKLLGRTKDERTLSVTGLTTGSKAGWGPR